MNNSSIYWLQYHRFSKQRQTSHYYRAHSVMLLNTKTGWNNTEKIITLFGIARLHSHDILHRDLKLETSLLMIVYFRKLLILIFPMSNMKTILPVQLNVSVNRTFQNGFANHHQILF